MDAKHVTKVINNFVKKHKHDEPYMLSMFGDQPDEPALHKITEKEVKDLLAGRNSDSYVKKNISYMSLAKDRGDATKEEVAVSNYMFKQRVSRTCNYCTRKYTFNLMVGDCNMGACNRSACVLASMRDHI